MKLRLPLALAAAVLAVAVSYSATTLPVETVVDITASEDFTADIQVNENGVLTIKGDGTVVNAPNIFMGGGGITNVEAGVVNITGTGPIKVGNRNAGDYSQSILSVKGGVFNATSAIIQLGNWGDKGYFNVTGGTANVKGLYLENGKPYGSAPTTEEGKGSVITLNGGRLNIGSEGIRAKDTEQNDEAVNRRFSGVNLISGTLGALSNWAATEEIDGHEGVKVKQTFFLSSGVDDLVIDTQNTAEGATDGFTITVGAKLEGTGTGRLIKKGAGTLYLSNIGNVFSQSLELNGGILKVASDAAMGTSRKISVTGTSEFVTEALTCTADFTIDSAATLTLTGAVSQSTLFSGEFSTGSKLVIKNKVAFDSGKSFGALTINNNASLGLSSGTYSIADAATVLVAHSGSAAQTQAAFTLGANAILQASGAKLQIASWNSTGSFTVGASASAEWKEIHMDGYNAQVVLDGGSLKIGAGGMEFKRVGNPDSYQQTEPLTPAYQSSKLYFNSGTLGSLDNWSTRTRDTGDAGVVAGTVSIFLDGDANTERLIQADHDVTIGVIIGDKEGVLGNFIKTGAGTLNLSAANSYSGGTEVREGTIALTGNGTMGTGAVKMFNGTGITGATSWSGPLTVTRGASAQAAVWGSNAHFTTLTMESGARLSVQGSLQADGALTFNFGSLPVAGAVVSATDAITLGAANTVLLVVNGDWMENAPGGRGTFQLFNKAISGDFSLDNLTWNRTDEKYSFDKSSFLSSGVIVWKNTESGYDYLTQEELNAGGATFTPWKDFYLGAAAGVNLVFGENVQYNLTPESGDNYRLTGGMGTLTFQAELEDGTVLYVKGDSNNPAGSVTLTNNGNGQTRTELTDTTLIVDSTAGGLAGIDTGANPVNILGTGQVNLQGTRANNAVLVLNTGGDARGKQDGSYIYRNDFRLNEYSVIRQEGNNSHLLDGVITVYAPTTTIINDSAADFILRSDLAAAGSTIHLQANDGRIVLDGGVPARVRAASTPRAGQVDVLSVEGTHGVSLEDGYALSANGVSLANGSSLSLDGDSVLSLGSSGIKIAGGTAVLTSGQSTIKATASSMIDPVVRLASAGQKTTMDVAAAGSTLELAGGVTGVGDLVKTGAGRLLIYAGDQLSTSGTIMLKEGFTQFGQPSNTYLGDRKVFLPKQYILQGGLDVESGAAVSGLIDANGQNVTFGSGSAFHLSVDGSQYSGSIKGASNMHFSDGVKLVVDAIQSDWETDTKYIVFRADTLTGGPLELEITGDFAFVDIQADYSESNRVSLILNPKQVQLDMATHNGREALKAIAPLALESLKGYSGSLDGELLNTMQVVSKMTMDELKSFVNETAYSASSLYSALSGQVLNLTQHVSSVRNRVIQTDPYLFDRYQEKDSGMFWVEGINTYSKLDGSSDAAGYTLDTWGGNMGVSFSLSPKAFMGVGFGYISGKTTLSDHYGDSRTDTYNMDLFGRYKEDAFSVSLMLSGGFSSADYTRRSLLQGETQEARGTTDGSQFLAMAEFAYDIALNESGSSIIQPLVNITAGYARFDSFHETGLGNAGFDVGAQSQSLATIGAGARYVYTTFGADKTSSPYRFEVSALVTQDMGDDDAGIRASYIGAPGSIMRLNGVAVDRTAFVAGASALVPLGANMNLFADVNGEFRSGRNSVNSAVGLSVMF